MKKSQRESIVAQGEELDQKILDIDEFPLAPAAANSESHSDRT